MLSHSVTFGEAEIANFFHRVKRIVPFPNHDAAEHLQTRLAFVQNDGVHAEFLQSLHLPGKFCPAHNKDVAVDFFGRADDGRNNLHIRNSDHQRPRVGGSRQIMRLGLGRIGEEGENALLPKGFDRVRIEFHNEEWFLCGLEIINQFAPDRPAPADNGVIFDLLDILME